MGMHFRLRTCLSYNKCFITAFYLQVADIDQDLAIAVLTSETRENQLSPGN